MNALTAGDIIPYTDYERQREAFRAGIIDLKKRRRISAGDLLLPLHAGALETFAESLSNVSGSCC